MQNLMVINQLNNGQVSMIYRTDNGTNTLLLEILSDLTKSPSISFSTGTTVTPTSEDFTYEVPSSIWVGDSSFTFTVSDSTGSETFTVYQAASTDINISLQETGERTYTLAVASSSTDISDNTVDTIDTITAEYPTLTAGERVRAFFGKIKKFLADLKDLKYDKAGGHISGGMYPDAGTYFQDATALPEQTAAASYNVMCIDAFSAGGKAKYCTATSSATANTIVTRQVNGHIYATYFNTTCTAENIATYTSPHIPFIDASGFMRKTSRANLIAWAKDDSGNKTLNATYGAYYERVNGMCTLRVDYRQNVTSTITVGTLPSGYRPPWQIMATNATGGANSAYLSVSATGTVQLAKVGNGGWCIATVTFPAV